MKQIFESEKVKKIFIFTAAISAILIVVLFLFFIAIKDKKTASPIAPIAPKERTLDELKKTLNASAGAEKLPPLPDELKKTLNAPIK